jgi:hypothetical protein
MKLPVYLFTGFLEGGKTSIIQESLNDQNFNSGEKTLVLMCEEGIEELNPEEFWGRNVSVQLIEDPSCINRAYFEEITKNRKIDRIIIEYNGMWTLQTLYDEMPTNWAIYQNMMFADANTFVSYNNNLRQLTVDKVRDAEMVVLNRTPDTIDKEEIHKIIRGISRRAAIVYDYPDGHVEYDELEDPLPFDLDAPVVEIEDEDYAIWYRDMSEELPKYRNKVIKVKGIVATDSRLPSNSVIIGRHVMTCCVDDIQYSGLVCVFKQPPKLKTRDWITVKGTLKIEQTKLYRQPGPVIYVDSTEFAVPPKQELATFY